MRRIIALTLVVGFTVVWGAFVLPAYAGVHHWWRYSEAPTSSTFALVAGSVLALVIGVSGLRTVWRSSEGPIRALWAVILLLPVLAAALRAFEAPLQGLVLLVCTGTTLGAGRILSRAISAKLFASDLLSVVPYYAVTAVAVGLGTTVKYAVGPAAHEWQVAIIIAALFVISRFVVPVGSIPSASVEGDGGQASGIPSAFTVRGPSTGARQLPGLEVSEDRPELH